MGNTLSSPAASLLGTSLLLLSSSAPWWTCGFTYPEVLSSNYDSTNRWEQNCNPSQKIFLQGRPCGTLKRRATVGQHSTVVPFKVIPKGGPLQDFWFALKFPPTRRVDWFSAVDRIGCALARPVLAQQVSRISLANNMQTFGSSARIRSSHPNCTGRHFPIARCGSDLSRRDARSKTGEFGIIVMRVFWDDSANLACLLSLNDFCRTECEYRRCNQHERQPSHPHLIYMWGLLRPTDSQESCRSSQLGNHPIVPLLLCIVKRSETKRLRIILLWLLRRYNASASSSLHISALLLLLT